MLRLFSEKIRVGVDLGSTSIKIVGLRKKGQEFELKFYDVIDLVQEYSLKSVDDIKDEFYIEQLQHLVMKYQLKNKYVSATLPANSAIIHNLKIDPSQSETEIVEKIQTELRQISIEPIDEMRIVCHQLEENNRQEKQLSLLACAIPNSNVERQLTVLEKSGLKVNLLDLDALGVYNAFYHYHSNSLTNPVTIVQIGSQYTICLIMLQGKTPFFYVMKLGGNTITKSIMTECALSFCKAETWKKRVYQPKWANNASYNKSNQSEIYYAFAEKLVTEVKKCIRHFQSYEGIMEIGSIYCTGGGAKLGSIAEYLNEQLQIDTRIWNPLNSLSTTSFQKEESVNQEKGFHLTPIIGTLLRRE